MDMTKKQIVDHIVEKFDQHQVITITSDQATRTDKAGKIVRDMLSLPYYNMQEVLTNVEVCSK